MEIPLPISNSKTLIAIPFLKPQNPNQIPFKSTFLSSKPSPKSSKLAHSTAHKTKGHSLTPLLRHDSIQDAILALRNGSSIDSKTYVALLQDCIDSDSIADGRRLHAAIGLVRDSNPFVEAKLVSMYAKCGSLDDARHVFNEMRDRNLFAWSAMISGCAREKRWEEVVELFFGMMHEGVVMDKLLFPKILQACGNIGDLETGRLLHSLAVRGGFLSSMEPQVGNAILAMYAKCCEFDAAKCFFKNMVAKDLVSWNSIVSAHCQFDENEKAFQLFERMSGEGIAPGVITWNILIANCNQLGHTERAIELMKKMESSGVAPDVFTWTSMISGFVQNNKPSRALDMFMAMLLAGVEPNGMTVASVISACASVKSLGKGKELHCYAIKIGDAINVLVGNALVDMYAKCRRLEDAKMVFDAMQETDVFTWNTMIGSYAQAGYCGKAYDLFSKMEDSGVQRNVVTWNVMISGYIENKVEDQAMELFNRMEKDGVRRNTATWNALIAGTLQNGHVDNALRIFQGMQSVSIRPNSVTILSILPACANLVSAWKVKEIHACVLHSGLESDTAVTNCLIDTYSKTGDLESAQMIFTRINSRDLISWNSIIAGCVLHGSSQVALDLFDQMEEEGIKPNCTTLTGIIIAYSLCGMVKEGKELFSSMVEEYQLFPNLDQYAGMVRLFGRSGRLREATEFIEKMPIEPDSSIWNALLTAARVHGNVKLALLASEHLIELSPGDQKIHRLLVHIQEQSGRTNDSLNVRKPKRESMVSYSHGCCWMVVKNKLHTFLTGVKTTKDFKFKHVDLNNRAEETKTILLHFPDAELDIEEDKEEYIGIHSEKLAIDFALNNTPSFRNVRIIKSIRMCKSCHTAAKLISKTHQREIFLKDPSCLHHFKDGKCSCRDYW